MPDIVRPTKKQQEALEFIEAFIAEHGYSPSYREIMVGCNYTSVATVALHVQSLIARGHLVKRGRSARSLEVTHAHVEKTNTLSEEVTAKDSKWLVQVIDARFVEVEAADAPSQKQIDELYVLVGALKVLGLHEAATSFMPRLKALRSVPATAGKNL
jgi:SOS-response transcriptional repressor LexA